jgi:GNAT superfamily N-acetyltransferase
MIVRNATDNDKEDLFKMVKTMATSFVPEYSLFEANFDKIIKQDNYKIIVAEKEGDLVGYIFGHDHLTFYSNGRISGIDELFVDELHRRNGIGKRLVVEFENWASDRGAKEMTVPTRRAADFYKALQYKESATLFIK